MYERTYYPEMGPYTPRVALALRTPANLQSASGVGVSALCGAVSTRETAVSVPGLTEL